MARRISRPEIFKSERQSLLATVIVFQIVFVLFLHTEGAFAQQFQSVSGSQVAANAFAKANWIFENAQTTHYKHNKIEASQQWQVGTGTCGMEADCSGFVSYVLHSVAPRQYEAIQTLQPDRPYPQAKTFAKFFTSLSANAPSSGWIKVNKFSDLRRGDVVAWEKDVAPGKRGNTGHVMFVVDKPGAVETIDGKSFASIHVLDCSSVSHFPPETLPPNTHQSQRDGLGKGMVRLLLDGDGNPVGYWEGTFSAEKNREIAQPTLSDNIAFGRLVDTVH